jgi:hypothetical protein
MVNEPKRAENEHCEADTTTPSVGTNGSLLGDDKNEPQKDQMPDKPLPELDESSLDVS